MTIAEVEVQRDAQRACWVLFIRGILMVCLAQDAVVIPPASLPGLVAVPSLALVRGLFEAGKAFSIWRRGCSFSPLPQISAWDAS